MTFSFLAPTFLAALLAVGVPVWVHLTARERRDALRFPSLRFLRRLPFRETRRQRLRDPLLFALRALAVILLALAFARPFLGGAWAAGSGSAAAGEVVIAIDRSYSMSYGETWTRAVAAAREAVAALGPNDRASLVAFAEEAEVAAGREAGQAALLDALDSLLPGVSGTRYGPALRLADRLLAEADGEERRLILISDFQARGWDRSRARRLHPGTAVEAIDVGSDASANVAVVSAEARRLAEGEGGGTMIVARLFNRGTAAVSGWPVRLSADAGSGGERQIDEKTVDLPASAGTTVELGPLPADAAHLALTVRGAADRLPVDDAFHLVFSSPPPLPVLLVGRRAGGTSTGDGSSGGDPLVYLLRALAVAEEPRFEVRRRAPGDFGPAEVEAAALVILHDAPFPAGAAGRTLIDHVASGAGLWVILGPNSRLESWSEAATALLPGTPGEVVDRLAGSGVGLARVAEDHPVFAFLDGPGGLGSARFYRYRSIVLGKAEPSPSPAPSGERALAHYTDGAVALAERRVGSGRVFLWGSPLDNRWSDLPLQPLFVPFVHEMGRHLGSIRPAVPWRPVGEALLARRLLAGDSAPPPRASVETPLGARLELDMTDGGTVLLEETGFYRFAAADRPAVPVAVNAERGESDLERLDVEAFVASTDGGPPSATTTQSGAGANPAAPDSRQRLWWFLLATAAVILTVESWIAKGKEIHP